MDRLRRDLVEVRRNRANQRKDRKRAPVPNAAIVGYTNAGKSSLLRRLTGADVLVENALFATLDTTTRKIELPNRRPLLLTDTVGFIRKLPHQLVESFNATLEEAVMADFLVHLLDASHPRVLEFHATTMHVLEELGADAKQTLTVFNKVDCVEDPMTKAMLRNAHPDALFVSVHSGEGLDALVARLAEFVGEENRELLLEIPHDRSDLVARLHREGVIHETEYLETVTRIRATVPPRLRESISPFAVV
jgi:GTP-binding protein HflX